MSTVLIIIIVVVAVLMLVVIPAIITLEQLDRQKRIMKMKRFRASVQKQKPAYSADDKRTTI